MGDFNISTAIAITNQLRRELLDGTIPAGSRILPRDLAARFSVSVVPIREALRHLDAEGLLVTSPQRATFAADIGIDELAGAYDLRRLVEPEYACRSALAASEADRKACHQALQALLDSRPNSTDFFSAHRNFHWSILAPSASTVVKNVLERLWQSIDRYIALGARRKSPHATTANIASFNREHASIAKAFIDSRPDQLRELLISHFNRNEASLRIILDEALSSSPPRN